jgi:phospholipid transport system transporter-binding protein
LTFETAQNESEQLQAHLADSKISSLCLDLSQVRQCDSAGLAVLIEAKRCSQTHNKTLVLEHMPEVVLALATFFGVEQMLG